MKNKSISIIAIVFYVIAVLMLAMACYFGSDALQYVKEYAEGYGMSISSMKKDAFGYIAQAALPYIIYAIICFGFGQILSAIHKLKAALATGTQADAALAAVETAAEAAVAEAEEVVEGAEELVSEAEEAVTDAEETAEKAVAEAEEAVAEAEETVAEVEDAAAEAALETLEDAADKFEK